MVYSFSQIISRSKKALREICRSLYSFWASPKPGIASNEHCDCVQCAWHELAWREPALPADLNHDYMSVEMDADRYAHFTYKVSQGPQMVYKKSKIKPLGIGYQ